MLINITKDHFFLLKVFCSFINLYGNPK